MKPCGFGRPSCTASGTLPAGPRSVTYSRQPRDRYSISSASVFLAWWTSQSMTGPEYMVEVLAFPDGAAGRIGVRPAPGVSLSQSLDVTRADLIGHRVMQDLDGLVDRGIGIGRDLPSRLADALHVCGIALLLRRHGLGVRQRVAERLVEGRRVVQKSVGLGDCLAWRDETRAIGDEDLVVVAF